MTELMDTSVTFGATAVRLLTCSEAWAALQRRERGLQPLLGDDDAILMAGIDHILQPQPTSATGAETASTAASAGPLESSAFAEKVGPSRKWGDIVDEELGPAGGIQDLLEEFAPVKSVSVASTAKKTKAFGCTACPRAFCEKRRLLAHWESAHSDTYLGYTCKSSGCGRTFHALHGNMYKQHLKNHQHSREDIAQAMLKTQLGKVVCSQTDRKASTVAPPHCIRTVLKTSSRKQAARTTSSTSAGRTSPSRPKPAEQPKTRRKDCSKAATG
jgi:hypothetical protein